MSSSSDVSFRSSNNRRSVPQGASIHHDKLKLRFIIVKNKLKNGLSSDSGIMESKQKSELCNIHGNIITVMIKCL